MRTLSGFYGAAIALLLPNSVAIAQITSDNTLNTSISRNNRDFTITQGSVAGRNLFHSFKEFSIPTGGSATFDLRSTPTITTIFSRVTGGNISSIDGTIRTINSKDAVSIFLLNPNGIIFGSKAQLRIGGSFLATSAQFINFKDGTRFGSDKPLLTMSVPVGLQFGSTPGKLTATRSLLSVPTDQFIALIGGSLTLDGAEITSAGGRIELGAIAEGQVRFNGETGELNYADVSQFENLLLDKDAFVRSSGRSGGGIQLQGKNITIAGYSTITSQTNGNRNGDKMILRATDSLEVVGFSDDGTLFSRVRSRVMKDATGKGSDIEIIAPNILIDGTLISTTTYGKGNAGEIRINTDRLTLTRSGQVITSPLEGTGQGGNLTINAIESIDILGAFKFTEPTSTGVFTLSSGLFAGVEAKAKGNSGNLAIATQRLNVLDGGRISASTTGAGNAGQLSIRAKDVLVSGVVVNELGSASGILATVEKGATGAGGNLLLQADQLQLQNGGQISASTFSNARAGDIFIQTQQLDMTGKSGILPSRIMATSEGTAAAAGSVRVRSQRLQISDGAEISVSARGSGNAGDLQIEANQLRLNRNGRLQVEAQSGAQGNVQLKAGLLTLSQGSSITTNATQSSNGGNIQIQSDFLIGRQNSDIVANAIEGKGGNIAISSKGIFGFQYRDTETFSNDITASSKLGINGTISLDYPNINPNTDLVELPTHPVDLTQQIGSTCSKVRDSRFVRSGRGGVPEDPSQYRTRDRPWVDLRSWARSQATPEMRLTLPLVEATTWKRNAIGQIELIAPKAIPHATSGSITCDVKAQSGG
jgi:filamentous hemagglutinin family protein